jgi:hypothetical protein
LVIIHPESLNVSLTTYLLVNKVKINFISN